MKDKMTKILNVATFVLLIICLIRISWINNELTNLKRAIDNERSMLQSSIDAISSNVRYELEQANNLLSDKNWSTDSLKIEDKTATFKCYVIPKEYNPEKTIAEIFCNDQRIPMILENGKYTAEITIPLFETSTISNVQFTEDEVIRTQKLDWMINPRYDMVPVAYMYFTGENSYSYKDETVMKTYSGSVEIDFEHKGLAGKIKEAEFVMLNNDKQVWSDTLVLEEMYDDGYITHYKTDIEQKFEIKKGDTIELYMKFTDTNGWEYRSILEDETIDEDGTPVSNLEYSQSEACIYNANGELLFEPYKY